MGSGFGRGGLGAEIGGDFQLMAGQILTAITGGQGGNGQAWGSDLLAISRPI